MWKTVPRQNAGGLSAIRMRTFQSSVRTRIAAQFLACHAELRIYQRCTQANELVSSRGHMSHKLSFMLHFLRFTAIAPHAFVIQLSAAREIVSQRR